MLFIFKRLFLFFCLSEIAYAIPKYASIVVDGETGRILHGVHETDQRYPASLTKKMTLYLIFEALQKGRISMKTRFRVSARAASQRPSKLGVQQGETVDVETIIKALIVRSANDIAVVAAEGLAGSVEKFSQLMTSKAHDLGMEDTIFKNPSGVNDLCTTDKGQYTTARDQAILGISLYRDFPQYTHYFKIQKFFYNGHAIMTHNHMLGKVNGLDGIKTGFANAPGFNISTSSLRYDRYNKPHRIFVVVMGGKTWRSRDRHAEELIEHGFKLLGCPSTYDETPKPDMITEDVTLEELLPQAPSKKSPEQDLIQQFINAAPKKKTPKNSKIYSVSRVKKRKKTKALEPTDNISTILKNTKVTRISKIKYKKFKARKK